MAQLRRQAQPPKRFGIDTTTPPPIQRMSCTDKVFELERLEASLPEFLDYDEKGQIAILLEAIDRNTAKSNASMTTGGSKRLLRKFAGRMQESHEHLKQMREVLRLKYDAIIEQRVALDRLIRGVTTSVNEQVDVIDEYLDEHRGEATVSQVDSHDSALEIFFNEQLAPRRTDYINEAPPAYEQPMNRDHDGIHKKLDSPGQTTSRPHKVSGRSCAANFGIRDDAARPKAEKPSAPEGGDRHCETAEFEARLHRLQEDWRYFGIRADAVQPKVEKPPAPEGGDRPCETADQEFEARLRRLQEDWRCQRRQPQQNAAMYNAPPPPVSAPVGRSTDHVAGLESSISEASQATTVIKNLADCIEKISARSELPPAPIEMFDGNPADYLFFTKNFQDRVGSKPFTDATKLSHLIEACTGHIKTEMMVFKGQTGGYRRALDDLEFNYGRPQQVVNAVMTNLTRGRELSGSDTRALKDFARQIETSYTLLDELGMTHEADTQANLKAIFTRLPHRMRVRWAERASDLEAKKQRPTFKTLVDFVVEQTRRSCHPVYEINPTGSTSDNHRDDGRVGNNRQGDRPINYPRPGQSNWHCQQPWRYTGGYEGMPPDYTYTNLATNPWTANSPGSVAYQPAYVAYSQLPAPPFFSYLSNSVQQGQQRTPSNPPHQPSDDNLDCCKFCSRAHKFVECPMFAASDVATRKKFVFDYKLCFICLGDHLQNVCRKIQQECTVPGCKGRHHRLLHGAPTPVKEQSASLVNALQGTDVLLRIVPVEVISKNGSSLSTYAMLDGGSTCSFIHAELAKELGIRGRRDRLELNTIADGKTHDVEIAECKLAPLNAPGEIIQLKNIYVMKDFRISYQPARDRVDFSKWSHLKELPLKLPVDRPVVGLLIGEGVPSAHEILENRYGADKPNEPYAARTNLGWYVAGPVPSLISNQVSAHIVKRERAPQHSTPCCDQTSATKDMERVIQKLGNEEKLGFECGAGRTLSVEDRLDLQKLKATVSHEPDGHYRIEEGATSPPVFKMDKHVFCAKDSPTARVFALQQSVKDHAHLFDTITSKEINIDSNFEDLPAQRALGLGWDVPHDTFRVKFTDVEKPTTRCGLLSFSASIIDPLGLIALAVLVGRLILQDTCKQSLHWDDKLPDDLPNKRWQSWRKGLHALRDLAIPRCYRGYENPELIKNVQLHQFCDASDVAYGVASYLRVDLIAGKILSTLIFGSSCKPLKSPKLQRGIEVHDVEGEGRTVEESPPLLNDYSPSWEDLQRQNSCILLKFVRYCKRDFTFHGQHSTGDYHHARDFLARVVQKQFFDKELERLKAGKLVSANSQTLAYTCQRPPSGGWKVTDSCTALSRSTLHHTTKEPYRNLLDYSGRSQDLSKHRWAPPLRVEVKTKSGVYRRPITRRLGIQDHRVPSASALSATRASFRGGVSMRLPCPLEYPPLLSNPVHISVPIQFRPGHL